MSYYPTIDQDTNHQPIDGRRLNVLFTTLINWLNGQNIDWKNFSERAGILRQQKATNIRFSSVVIPVSIFSWGGASGAEEVQLITWKPTVAGLQVGIKGFSVSNVALSGAGVAPVLNLYKQTQQGTRYLLATLTLANGMANQLIVVSAPAGNPNIAFTLLPELGDMLILTLNWSAAGLNVDQLTVDVSLTETHHRWND